MVKHLNNLDWVYIRSFLAVAETGSLTAAAKRLGQSQPTIGRHIKAAEEILGAELFTRSIEGFRLTDVGLILLGPAQEMAAASAKFELLASGCDMHLSGTVRITASIVMSHYLLPEIIADIRVKEPQIELELVPSDVSENLLFRDADIAVRMFRPTQLDIITKHIGDQSFALYASKKLFSRHGQPKNVKELAAIPFVGFDKSDMIIRSMRDIGFQVDRHFFGVRCDDQAAFWRLVCSGCGIGAMQTVIGDAEPLVERLEFQPKLPTLPIWLAAPEALHKSARIKRVWNLLSSALSKN